MSRAGLSWVMLLVLVGASACQRETLSSPPPYSAPSSTRHVTTVLAGSEKPTPGLAEAPLVVDGQFAYPEGVTADASGNVYVADGSGCAISKVTPDGMTSILAGGTRGGAADGTGPGAQFHQPSGITVDQAGNVYVADEFNQAIRKITPAGVVSTLAGGRRGFSDGVGNAATFFEPRGIVVDGSGVLYVADTCNNAIRKVTPDGVVSTIAGGTQGAADGSGARAQFNQPESVAVDRQGNLYVADGGNNAVRKVTAQGEVTTVAGGSQGRGDGVGSAAQFSHPMGIVIDSAGDLYVADTGAFAIRKVTEQGVVTTLAGGATGQANGSGSAAQFDYPRGLGIDEAGNLYVADANNRCIRRVTRTGAVTTFVESHRATDTRPVDPALTHPSGLAVDERGSLVVTDYFDHSVRRVTPQGVVSNLAGGRKGPSDGTGPAAEFNSPWGVAVDSAGNLYVADTGNHAIRKIAPDRSVTTLAGGGIWGTGGAWGSTDGTGRAALFNNPNGVAVDASGNLYVADTSNHAIRKVTAAGVVTTLAGGSPGPADGKGTAAQFNHPTSIAIDGSGNLWVADSGNYAIRKVTPEGVVTTVAGGTAGPADGIGNKAQLSYMSALCVDAKGTVYVAEPDNNAIRQVTPAGAVTTLQLLEEATGAAASLHKPEALGVDHAGQLWVAQYDGAIRVIR